MIGRAAVPILISALLRSNGLEGLLARGRPSVAVTHSCPIDEPVGRAQFPAKVTLRCFSSFWRLTHFLFFRKPRFRLEKASFSMFLVIFLAISQLGCVGNVGAGMLRGVRTVGCSPQGWALGRLILLFTC